MYKYAATSDQNWNIQFYAYMCMPSDSHVIYTLRSPVKLRKKNLRGPKLACGMVKIVSASDVLIFLWQDNNSRIHGKGPLSQVLPIVRFIMLSWICMDHLPLDIKVVWVSFYILACKHQETLGQDF